LVPPPTSIDRKSAPEALIPTLTFNPQALLDAVDAERRARGLTWAELSRQLRISTTTIRSMPTRRWGIELDGVIGLARWLGRTVESFAGGDGGPPPRSASYADTGRALRFDTAGLYTALAKERERRGMTWELVAAEIWPALSEPSVMRVEGPALSEPSVMRVEGPSGRWGANQLKALAKGGRADVDSALAICGWLGRTIQSFSRESIA